MRQHPAAERNRTDRQLTAAHDRVLNEWSDGRIEELSDIVRHEPLYQPLSPSPTEAAFYHEREQVRQEIEMEPVTETVARSAVVIGYRVTEDEIVSSDVDFHTASDEDDSR